jgi:hypothetical protein
MMNNDAVRNPYVQPWRMLTRAWRGLIWLSLAFLPLALGNSAGAQASLPPSPLQQRIQAVQQVAAENARRLHEYQWIETATVTINGSTKPAKQSLCHYGPDGKVSKTPIGSAQEAPQPSGGPLMRRIEKKKTTEVKEEFAEIGSLSAQYLPLHPALLKQALETRRVALEHDGSHGSNAIVIHDYVKPSDQLILTLDTAMKTLQQVEVQTYLSSASDPVSITVRFSALPDGTSYPSVIALDEPAKRLSSATVSADFTKAVL